MAQAIVYLNGSSDYIKGFAYQYDYSAAGTMSISTVYHMAGYYIGTN